MPQNLNPYDEAVAQLPKPQPAPTRAPNPYDQAVPGVAGDQMAEAARRNRVGTAESNPDSRARAIRVGKELGLPSLFIADEDLDATERALRERQTPYATMGQQSPALTAWLAATQDNAAISRGDEHRLGLLEWLVTAPPRAAQIGLEQVRISRLRTKQLMGGELTPEEDAQLAGSKGYISAHQDLDIGNSWFRQAITGTSQLLPNIAAGMWSGAKYAAVGAAETAVVGAGIGAGVGALGAGAGAGPGAAAGALTGAGVGARAGFLYGGAKFGFELEAGLAYDEYLDVRDPITKAKIDPEAAKAAAIAAGALNAGLEAFQLGKLAGPLKARIAALGARQTLKQALAVPTTRAALAAWSKDFLKENSQQALTEGVQRLFTILAGEWAKSETPDGPAATPPAEIAKDVASEVAGAALSFAPLSAASTAATARQGVKAAKDAQATTQYFLALGEGAAQSETLQRAPAAVKDLIDRATDGQGVAAVEVPVERWTEYWQSVGQDPAEVADVITGRPGALAEAQQTGEGLEISMGAYATTLAPTPHNAALADSMRMVMADGTVSQSGLEAQMLIDAQAALAGTEGATATEGATPPAAAASAQPGGAPGQESGVSEPGPDGAAGSEGTPTGGETDQALSPSPAQSLAQLAKDVTEQLVLRGGYAPREAAQTAELLEKVFGRTAVDAGADPYEVYRRYGFEVVRSASTAGRLRAPAGTPTASAAGTTPSLPLTAEAEGADTEARDGIRPRETQSATGPGGDAGDRVAPSRPSAAENDVARTVRKTKGEDARSLERRRDSARGEALEQRRLTHYEQLFEFVSQRALAIDPALNLEALRAEFDERIAQWDYAVSYYRESGHDPSDLLRTIAAMGGINTIDATWPGEVAQLQEGLKFGAVRGIKGVFQKSGLPIDTVATDLTQDERFQWITDRDVLLSAIDDALRFDAKYEEGVFPGSDTLREDLGIDTSRAWWASSWHVEQAADAAQFAGDAIDTGGEADFDISELEQDLLDIIEQAATTEDTLDTGEVQPRLPGAEDVRDQDTATPQLDVPFSLTSEAAEDEDGDQGTLFQPLRADAVPRGYATIAQHLTPQETRALRRDTAQALVDVFRGLPSDADVGDAALAGIAKLGWYERATEAIRQVFGETDAPRFAALLAALSPRNTVEQNFENTVRLWVAWSKAGRPTSRRAIVGLMAKHLKSGSGNGVLPSWVPNTVRALSTPIAHDIVLSGPKVDSFARNLWGHLHEVTNDSWMAMFFNVEQTMFGGNLQAEGTDPGKGPAYKAVTAKIRRVAERLTQQTGQLWTPAHVQETIWSWAKTLYELSEAEGMTAEGFLTSGKLTDQAIAKAPDFATLLTQNADVRSILEAAGYGEVLAELEPGASGSTGRGAAGQRRPRSREAIARAVTPGLLRAARRLDATRRQRAADKLARATAAREERELGQPVKPRDYSREYDAFGPVDIESKAEAAGEPLEPGALPVQARFANQGWFATSTRLTKIGERVLGVSKVTTPHDAATALAHLARSAVERFDALVVDKAGKPLAIVGSFKGDIDQTLVVPVVIAAEAVQVEGAAQIWFAHNHPSGNPILSSADLAMQTRLEKVFKGSGIEPRGFFAIGAADEAGNRGYTYATGQLDALSSLGSITQQMGVLTPQELKRTRKVPIVERELVQAGKLSQSQISPRTLGNTARALVDKRMFGILTVDTQLRPTALVKLDPTTQLRDTGGLRQLLEALSTSAPGGLVIIAPQAEHEDAAWNLAQAVHQIGVPVHDVLFNGTSWRESGSLSGLTGEFFQEKKGKAPQRRGSIRGVDGGNIKISLFEKADPSTFLHEAGHFFLKLLHDLAGDIAKIEEGARTEGQQRVLANYQAALDGLGVTSWAQLTEAHHERWADSFESYLRDGQAPSEATRSLFTTFRLWLLRVYETNERLGGDVSPALRAVFDRLLASDVEIAAAERRGHVGPMFSTAKDAGMSDARWAVYQADIRKAHDEAVERFDTKLQQEVLRKQTEEWKLREAEVRAEVEAEVYARPVYRALSAMRRGTEPSGQLIEGRLGAEPMRLNRPAVLQEFGPAVASKLPAFTTVSEGGYLAEELADLFGFSSADALLGEVSTAPPMRQVITELTAGRMAREFGSILLDGQMAEQAQAAVANERLEEVRRAELRALAARRREVAPFVRQARDEQKAKTTEQRARADEAEQQLRDERQERRQSAARIRAAVPSAATILAAARARVWATKVGELRPERFWYAMQRASRLATEKAAIGDNEAAIAAKTQELLDLAIYREMVTVKELRDKRLQAGRELARTSAQQRLGLVGPNWLAQINGFLTRYGLATVDPKTLATRPAIEPWLAGLVAEGYPVSDLPPIMADDQTSVPWKQLTVDQFINLTDGIAMLVQWGRSSHRLFKVMERAEFIGLKDKLVARARSAVAPKTLPLEPGAENATRLAAGNYYARMLKLGAIARILDGGVDDGPWWNAIVRPFNEADDAERTRKQQAFLAWSALYAQLPGGMASMTEKQEIAGVGALSRQARLAVALNWGTETNRNRLLNDPVRNWSEAQVQAILDTLTAEEWTYVKGTWEQVNSYWPEIAALQQRVTGLEPQKVEALPFQTRFGEMPGGYYPIVYDARLGARQQQHDTAEAAKALYEGAYLRATTKQGHNETRKAMVKASLRLEVNVAFTHVEQVIHDLTHREVFLDVNRILRNREVADTLYVTVGQPVYKQMVRAIEAIAAGNGPTHQGEEAFSWMRQGTQIAALAYNFWTAVQQPSGLFNGAQRIGYQWVWKGAQKWLSTPRQMAETVRWISERSAFMRDRGITGNQDLLQLRNDFKVAGGWFDQAVRKATNDVITQQTITDSFLWHIALAQRVADVPTWLGAYEKHMADGREERTDEQHEARAIALADQAVIDSQGSGSVKDLSDYQRGGPAFKLWLMFYSYGATTLNSTAVAWETGDMKTPAGVAKFLADLSSIYVLPAMFTVIAGNLIGHDDDEGWREYLWHVASESLGSALNGLVLFRELSTGLRVKLLHLEDGGTRGYEGPTGARLFNLIDRLFTQAGQAEADEALVKALLDVGAIVLKFPGTQAQKTVKGWVAIEEGKTRSPWALLVGPPPEDK